MKSKLLLVAALLLLNSLVFAEQKKGSVTMAKLMHRTVVIGVQVMAGLE